MVSTFNPEKHFLGAICTKGHAWQSGNQGLRYIKDGKCVNCVAEREAKRRERDKDKIKAYKQEYYKKNWDKIEKKRREYRESDPERWRKMSRDYYYRNHEICKEKARKKNAENPEPNRQKAKEYYYQHYDAVKVKRRIYRKRNRPKLNEINRINRSMRSEQYGVRFKPDDLREHYGKFNTSCVYCNSSEPPTLDHFIALSKGGVNCLGNIVPACYRCNRSKSCSDPYEWFQKQPFFSEKRWKFILKTLGRSTDNYHQLPLF